MTHLNIQQSSNVEIVGASLIQKLYETALATQDTTLAGNLQCEHCYQSAYEYLTGSVNGVKRFPNLNINVTGGVYISFADHLIESILATNFGDGVGITQSTAATVSSFNGKFDNSNITSFNELPQFTNITTINENNRFNGCTSLTSIDLKNITKVSGNGGYQRWNFENCTSLTTIGDTSNITYVGFNAFGNCPLQGVIDFSNVTVFGGDSLYQPDNIAARADLSQCTIDPSKIIFIGNDAFHNCSSFSALSTINFPNLESTTQDGSSSSLSGTFANCTQIQHVVSLGKITDFGNVFSDGCFGGCNNILDITLPETLTTVKYSAIGRLPNLRYVKILATSLPQYSSTNGFGSQYTYGTAFGEGWRNGDVTGTYEGSTYPIYVRDDLLSQYQADSVWSHVGPNRLRPLSQFATDFPNG